MIGVRKIAYACYEMPDPQQQAEYYTDILGLTLIEKDKDAIYLANTVDHHSVVLRKGAEAKCVRLGFQIGPDDDLAASSVRPRHKASKPRRSEMPDRRSAKWCRSRIRKAR